MSAAKTSRDAAMGDELQRDLANVRGLYIAAKKQANVLEDNQFPSPAARETGILSETEFDTMVEKFKALDEDHTGVLELDEVRQLMLLLNGIEPSDEELDEYMAILNTNMDNHVDFYELMAHLYGPEWTVEKANSVKNDQAQLEFTAMQDIGAQMKTSSMAECQTSATLTSKIGIAASTTVTTTTEEEQTGGWTVVWSSKEFVVPRERVLTLAQESSQIWVRTVDDHSYGAISKPGSWPIECLRKGRAFSKPLEGGEATREQVAEAWDGPEHVLEHLWNYGTPDHDFLNENDGVIYHACCNGDGLHISADMCGWVYGGVHKIEVPSTAAASIQISIDNNVGCRC